jgi:hypothetical protein
MRKVIREYVDAALFIEAASRVVTVNQTSFSIELYFHRYTMNPHGYHIGYETYCATIDLVEKRGIEKNRKQEEIDSNSKYLVDLSTMDVSCTDCPESEACSCENPEDCMCELYYNPIDDPILLDWAYEEALYHIDQILKTHIEWVFNAEKMEWVIQESK